MTSPRTIVCGDGDNVTRISYLRTRRVLRLTSGASAEGRELSLAAFCDALGIEPEAVAPPTYLLFAGTGRAPAGGHRDLVATYDCPQEARRDFALWRRDSACQWAELVSCRNGRIAALCWFGVDRLDRDLPARPAAATRSGTRRWRRARPAQTSARA